MAFMKTLSRCINFYNEFSCSCADCPATCCKGWLVPIDDNTLEKYKKLKGIDGLKFRLSLREKSGLKCFNTNLKVCSFYDKDSLCSLQKKYGESYLSDVCRLFPRTLYKIPLTDIPESGLYSRLSFASAFLELSCPEAAKLFVKHMDDMSIIDQQLDIGDESSSTNDDFEFYKFLLELNQDLNELIENSSIGITQIYGSLYDIGRKIQEIFVTSKDSETAISLSNSYVQNYISDCKEFTITATQLDKFITGGYYHTRVKGESPFLYELCKLYFKKFDDLKISDIDKIIKRLPEGIKTSESLTFSMDKFLRQHLKYVLSATFNEIFEDYSFHCKFTIAILRTQLLSVFMWLYSNSIEPINEDNLVKILYSFHRRGAGNDGLFLDFYNLL